MGSKRVGGAHRAWLLFPADQDFVYKKSILPAKNEERRVRLALVNIVIAHDQLNIVLIVRAAKRNRVRFGQQKLTFGTIQRLGFTIADANASQVSNKGIQPGQIQDAAMSSA